MTSATPIEISRSSSSPQNRSSNLTSALQQQQQQEQHNFQQTHGQGMHFGDAGDSSSRLPGSRQDSLGFGLNTVSAARPISMKERRESTAAGSFMGGMSWGGMSVGSWIQDDIMTGTSPMNVQSPSFHSSSYLPKMEASFWNNLRCCDKGFADLHELLQHYEEEHNQSSGQFTSRMSASNNNGRIGFGRKPSAAGGAFSPGDSMKPQEQVRGFQPLADPKPNGSPLRLAQDANGFRKTSLSNVQDMDTLGEMELDDDTPPPPSMSNGFAGFNQQNASESRGPSAPQINTGLAQMMQQESNPNTPTAANPGMPLSNNPMVSSVNTPTLNTPALMQDHNDMNGDMNMDMSGMHANMPFNQEMLQQINNDFGSMDFSQNSNEMLDLCINDPAKKLFSNEGTINASQFPQFNFMNGANGTNTNQAEIQARQLAAARTRFPGEEDRPFKCPVIGCEKAYKNANGLRYHEKHGHSTQKLKENGDGTFSIVDPVTSLPYPGTVGMEKEKPYRCEVCGKRYKNLNGLKYHRNHSPPCNPDFNFNNVALPGMQAPSLSGDTAI